MILSSVAAPVLSVVIPTCHRNGDLIRCLEALRAQQPLMLDSNKSSNARSSHKTDFSYEFIVTDDGTQSTAAAVIRDAFPGVKWVQGPRRGPAANRNFGASKAVGKWLLFLDDDCLPSSNWLAAYGLAILTFPQCGVLEGRTIASGPRTRADQECPLNLKGGLLWSCNFGIRRDLFFQIGGFDEQFPAPALEDMDLKRRLDQAGHVIRFLVDACVEHPWRPRRGARFCISVAQSVLYFTIKHAEVRPIFVKTWGIKRIIKIISFEFPRNLFRYRNLSSFRLLYLDLLTAVHISLALTKQRLGVARKLSSRPSVGAA